jgi:hypothetical protein
MSKDKTVSFRIGEEKFNELRAIADDEGFSLSSVFRDYVDDFVSHNGDIEVVPEHRIRDDVEQESDVFPPTAHVSKSFVRQHEEMELECEHLREQLDEYKRYARHLEDELAALEEDAERMVRLEEIDYEAGTALQIE